MVGRTIGICFLVVAMAGCGGTKGPKPLPLAPVTGIIQLAGKPLDEGQITVLVV